MEQTRSCIGRAEAAYAEAAGGELAGWRARVATEAHLYATTGHAIATVARRFGEASDRREAIERLTAAVQGFDLAEQARAYALCVIRLALLHLDEDLEAAAGYAKLGLEVAGGLRSERVWRALFGLKTAASAQSEEPARQIAELISDSQRGSHEG